MIRHVPQGITPKWDLTIAGVAVNYQSINGMHITLSENQHDMLVLDMAGVPARALTDYIGKPVFLKINTGPNYTCTFAGRVEKTVPKSATHLGMINGSPFQQTDVVCMGRSYDMRGKRNAVWDGHTLPQIATILAKRYNLSLDVPNAPLMYLQSAQSSESDWQFLVRQSKAHGYSITCHGTHIHIFDPYAALGRQTSLHKLLTQSTLKGYAKMVPGSIITFNPNLAERHPDGQYMDTLVTVLQDDGITYEVTTSEVMKTTGNARFTNRLNDTPDNYEEAVRIIKAADKEVYDYTADVQTVGLLGCVPGGVVEVDKYNGDFDGYWYVQEVEHHLTSEQFVTDLKIARNKNSELDVRASTRFVAPPIPKPYNGTLVASRSYHNVY